MTKATKKKNLPAQKAQKAQNAIQKMAAGLELRVSDLANSAVRNKEVLDVQIKKGRSGFVMRHTPGHTGGKERFSIEVTEDC